MKLKRMRGGSALPVITPAVMVIAALTLPLWGERSMQSYDIMNMLQGAAGPGLLALGLGLTMIIGEFDISTLGMYAIGGMLAVQTGADAPVVGVLVAVAFGMAVGALQGFVIVRTGIGSMALTLGTYIALVGLTGVLGHDNTVSYDNSDVPVWLDQTIASIVSPRSLVTIVAVALVGLVLSRTRLGSELRAVGGDRRASRAAGVPASAIVTSVFAAAGGLAALGGALFAYSSATAASTIGLSPLIFAVTAILLGGVSLSGGHGGAGGIGAGVISLALLNQIFVVQGTPSYVADIVLGGLLVLAVVLDAPDMIRARVRMTSRYAHSRQSAFRTLITRTSRSYDDRA